MASETPFTFQEVSVDDVVTKAMKEFKKISAGEYDEHLFGEESNILEAVMKQAENDAQLYRKLAPLVAKEAGSAELEAAMSTILSAEELQLIKDTFLFDTYQVEVYTCSKPGPKSFVKFLREGEEIFPDITLVSSSEILKATWLQWASIVIEVFMLALSCIGIHISLRKSQLQKITQAVEKTIETPAFRKALDAFKKAWSNGNAMARAKAIFMFLKDSFTAGIFWKVMKSIFSTMSKWDYARAIATTAAMIVAAFATGGAVLIAKILMALDSAYALVQKMRNLEALEKIEQEHNEMVLNTLML